MSGIPFDQESVGQYQSGCDQADEAVEKIKGQTVPLSKLAL